MAALASAVIVSAPQAKAYTLSNAESVATNTGIGLSEEKPQAAVRAPQESTDPNYANDEAKIKDFNGSERYRSSQLDPGVVDEYGDIISGGPYYGSNAPDMEFKDGYRYNTLEPSATSPDKTKWGFEIEFDKENGQRTYTDFSFTNSGNLGSLLDTGEISANAVGKALAESFNVPNYEATSKIAITGSRTQRNLNLYATEDDLKYINSIDNNKIIMAWEGRYTSDPTGQSLRATQGSNALFTFTVNPWPNENDMLALIKLNGSHNQKEFVQGQTITTGIKVENLDENARERLVGQVYHPVTGEIVPGAEAYIDENDKVVVKMPEGVIDENGNLNKDSIFYKDPKYKALQNLEVKFFARPRTAAEFKAVSDKVNFGAGAYTPTGAGTETINHKGQDVVIDKQGIDRYDHYNEIGRFKINLDDTRYYDQGFIDGNDDDTSKHTSSAVKPGEEFEVKLYVPEDKKDKDLFPNQKTPEEMGTAKDENQAVGTIDWQYINQINKGKKEEDQWKLEYDESTLPTTFKITPPKSAKAGEFVAVPLTYTYTNGSTDVHWFHFVVQESTNNRPDYFVQVDYPSEEQKSKPKLPENPDDKKLTPQSYSIPEGTEFKDNKGNEWTVSIDETTGIVTAQPKDPSKFDGGETLTVPVVAHYKDPLKPDEDITEETKAEFVIKERANMTPRYNAKAGKSGDKLSSNVILNEEDKYNRRPTKFTLESDTFTDDKGNTWNVSIDENTGTVTATVPDGEGDKIDGALLNVPVKAHYYENDGTEIATKEVEVQFVASGTEEKVEKILDVPFETKVEKDPELKKGEIKVVQEGEVGSKKVTYTIKDSKITDTKEEELKAPKERIIHVGEGVNDGTHKIEEKVEVPYEVEIQFDDSLAPGEQQVTQEGVPGEKTRTTTITIQDGKVTNVDEGEYTETKAPQKKIIKVGAKTEGKVEHKEEIPFKYTVEFDPEFHENYPDATDNYKVVTDGVAGEKTTTWTIKNSQIVEGPTSKQTKDPVDAIIKVGQKDYTGTLETKKTKAIEFETEYKVDNSLQPGQVVVEQEGSLGEEETTVTHTIVNGEVTKSEEGTPVQTKAPVKRIVKVGPGKTDGTHEYTNKIPYEVKIRVNPELKKGERKVIQKGEPGEEKYTLTIENSKVVKTSDPERTKEPKPEIIEVGTEDYTGEFEYVDKEVIPFDTEVKINPNLEPNQIKEITPGENGSKERKITQKYTNGEKGDLVVGEYKTTKEPVTRVIEVGPGKTDGTHTYTSKKPFEVEVRVNPELKKGEYKVVQKGVDGEEEYTITIENSKVTNISEPKETKAPVNEIIEVGEGSTDGEVKHVEEIPFKYQVEESDELKPGEYKIVKPGKVGTITTTWTIKDSQVVGDPKVERVEPEDALIQVGKGTPDGTHDFKEKKEIPFETIIEYDDSLEPGEEKVVQEGKPGEQERTNTIVIENGKVKEIKEGEFKTTSEPVNKIVKIGRKKPDGETTKTVEREIPYETKVIYDETLEAGFQKIENEGKPGKEKVTITTKIVDGKLVTTESTEKIEDKEDRVVRIGIKPVVKETELGHDTEYRYNPNLKEGEQKVIEEGSNGKVEYTITFNKETGKIEVSEKRTEPKNKIVEIGYKTDGKVKVESEIPFEVEIIEDPEMEAGKTEVVQEGKLGKKETIVTIENSKEVSREENIIEKPVKKIIKVGTKNVCEIPPVDPDPEQPDGKDPKDPEQPGGKDPKDPETPGGKDPKDPEQPGEEDPKDPEKRGEDPKDPEHQVRKIQKTQKHQVEKIQKIRNNQVEKIQKIQIKIQVRKIQKIRNNQAKKIQKIRNNRVEKIQRIQNNQVEKIRKILKLQEKHRKTMVRHQKIMVKHQKIMARHQKIMERLRERLDK
ncbi:MAG: G5 domain-containing protein [Finegoldia magna]